MANEKITVSASVNVPVGKVWELWTGPEHITKWNNASDDWHSPSATNDLKNGGRFTCRMEAKDKSAGFDFGGTYDEVVPNKKIAYTMDDGRKVEIEFNAKGDTTEVNETFEAESTNSIDMQKTGWQNIMDNFKKYAESN